MVVGMVAHTMHIHKKIKNGEDLGGVAYGPGTCKTEEKGLVYRIRPALEDTQVISSSTSRER